MSKNNPKVPKNIHLMLVKKEDVEKDKNKRIIRDTDEWRELRGYVGLFILWNREIFKVTEVQHKKELKENGMLKPKYWEIDYSGVVGLHKGKNRRVYNLHKLEYKDLRRFRLAYLEMVDEFDKWGIYKDRVGLG